VPGLFSLEVREGQRRLMPLAPSIRLAEHTHCGNGLASSAMRRGEETPELRATGNL